MRLVADLARLLVERRSSEAKPGDLTTCSDSRLTGRMNEVVESLDCVEDDELTEGERMAEAGSGGTGGAGWAWAAAGVEEFLRRRGSAAGGQHRTALFMSKPTGNDLHAR